MLGGLQGHAEAAAAPALPLKHLVAAYQDPTPGPQPQLSRQWHMDTLRGGSHPLAVWVQLSPEHPLVPAVLPGTWLQHEGAPVPQAPVTPPPPLQRFGPSWESPVLCLIQTMARCSPNLPPVPGRCHRTLSPILMWPVSPWVPPCRDGSGLAGAAGAVCLSPGASRQDGMYCPKWHLN